MPPGDQRASQSVLCYLDYILIYSKTKEEHLQHIGQVLTILRNQKLLAKPTKCDFGRTEVQFLRFRVWKDQIRNLKDEDKVSAVSSCDTCQKNKASHQGKIGMIA